jgi:hypothetical protein
MKAFLASLYKGIILLAAVGSLTLVVAMVLRLSE